MNEIIHGYVVSVILTKFRINANIQLWQSFSILNFEIGIVSDFLQYINPCLELKPFKFLPPFRHFVVRQCNGNFDVLHFFQPMTSQHQYFKLVERSGKVTQSPTGYRKRTAQIFESDALL